MSAGAHAYLVQRAARWLRGSRKCSVVVTEKPVWDLPMIPDVLGWTHDGYSIHIECKISRADFVADARKPAARLGIVVGDERWYLAPKGILSADDMPVGVGLLEVCGQVLRKRATPTMRRRSLAERAESILLVHATWHAIGGHLGRRGDVATITRHDRPQPVTP